LDGDALAELHPTEESNSDVQAEWKTALNLAD
jgi:hypothetical protein